MNNLRNDRDERDARLIDGLASAIKNQRLLFREWLEEEVRDIIQSIEVFGAALGGGSYQSTRIGQLRERIMDINDREIREAIGDVLDRCKEVVEPSSELDLDPLEARIHMEQGLYWCERLVRELMHLRHQMDAFIGADAETRAHGEDVGDEVDSGDDSEYDDESNGTFD